MGEDAMNNEEVKIKERIYDYQKAINNGDFESWLNLWSEEGIQMPPSTSLKIGIDHIRGANKFLFHDLTLRMDVMKFPAIKVFNDIGISVCEYRIMGERKDGGEKVVIMENGKALTIFKKQDDGSWKIIFDCFNSNK
jgi:ketosteroid isomerase-like protein